MQPLSRVSKSGYLPTLDGWRAIAISAVIIDHAFSYQSSAHGSLWFAITRIGPNGVSLFFAISGFLICSRLLEEDTAFGRISLRGFYIRRAFRILPPALTYLAVIAILAALGTIRVSSSEWWASVFFFRNYLPSSPIHRAWGEYTIHYWSLAVEEHFYLLWPAILVLSPSKRAKWACLALIGIAAAWKTWDAHYNLIGKLLPRVLVGSRTDIRIDGLLAGCLAALVLADPNWAAKFRRLLNLKVWAACAVAYVSIPIFYRHHYYTILESLLLAAVVSATVVNHDTFVAKFLELQWLRWIGRLSYSLYLWQQLFLVREARFPVSLLEQFPLNLITLAAVAALSYRLIEKPMIRIGHRLAPPSTPGREDAVPAAESSEPLPEPETAVA